MQILIVTPEAARWTAFGEGLRAAGLSCSFAGAPDDLKAESLKADRPLLVLWDEPYTGDALRAAGIGVIMADARINQSACTDEGHETFHEKVEGLGFLPNVPLTRTAEDARALADSLVKVSALCVGRRACRTDKNGGPPIGRPPFCFARTPPALNRARRATL